MPSLSEDPDPQIAAAVVPIPDQGAISVGSSSVSQRAIARFRRLIPRRLDIILDLELEWNGLVEVVQMAAAGLSGGGKSGLHRA